MAKAASSLLYDVSLLSSAASFDRIKLSWPCELISSKATRRGTFGSCAASAVIAWLSIFSPLSYRNFGSSSWVSLNTWMGSSLCDIWLMLSYLLLWYFEFESWPHELILEMRYSEFRPGVTAAAYFSCNSWADLCWIVLCLEMFGNFPAEAWAELLYVSCRRRWARYLSVYSSISEHSSSAGCADLFIFSSEKFSRCLYVPASSSLSSSILNLNLIYNVYY
jgi:hypothetical protein